MITQEVEDAIECVRATQKAQQMLEAKVAEAQNNLHKSENAYVEAREASKQARKDLLKLIISA